MRDGAAPTPASAEAHQWARPSAPMVHEEDTVQGEEGEVVEPVTKPYRNMPTALFKQQMQGIKAMLDFVTVARENTGPAQVPSKTEMEESVDVTAVVAEVS